jgi:hypothetical protein
MRKGASSLIPAIDYITDSEITVSASRVLYYSDIETAFLWLYTTGQ